MPAEMIAYSAHPEDSSLTVYAVCGDCGTEWGWHYDDKRANDDLLMSIDAHNTEFHPKKGRAMLSTEPITFYPTGDPMLIYVATDGQTYRVDAGESPADQREFAIYSALHKLGQPTQPSTST